MPIISGHIQNLSFKDGKTFFVLHANNRGDTQATILGIHHLPQDKRVLVAFTGNGAVKKIAERARNGRSGKILFQGSDLPFPESQKEVYR